MGLIRKLVRELHRRSLWQVLVTFVGGSWVVLEVIDQLTETAGLPDWVPSFALVLLLIGLPVVLATAFVQQGLPGAAEKGVDAEEAMAARPQPDGQADAPETVPVAGSVPTPEAAETSFSGQLESETSPRTPMHSRLFTWRKAILGGVGAFTLLGVAVAGYFAMRLLGIGPAASLMAQGVLEERDPVVLADFQNHSSDPSAGSLVTEALRVDLVESRTLTLASPARVQEVLTRMGRDPNTELATEIALEVAEREGLKAVIKGEVASAGEGYLLIASLVATTSGDILASFRETAETPDDIVNAIDKLSERIREKVGESLRTIREGEPLRQVTTSSIDALRKYTDAVRLIDRGESLQGIGLLEEATQIDTAFAMAYRKLSVAKANMGFPGSEVREAATKAYQHRQRLGEIEGYLTAANYHEKVTSDGEAAIRAYRNVLRLDPHQRTALNNLGLRFFTEGRYTEAQPLFDTAMAATPFPLPFSNGARNLLFLGDTSRAIAVAARFEEEYPGHWRAQVTRLFVEIHRGDSGRAHAAGDALQTAASATVPVRATGVAGGGYVDRAAGKWAEAREHIRDAAQFAEMNGNPSNALAWHLTEAEELLVLAADTAAARRRLREILADSAFYALEPDRRPWDRFISDLARFGLTAEAQEYFDRWEKELPETVRGPEYALNRTITRAVLDLAISGDVERAIRTIHESRVGAQCPRCYRSLEAELEARRGRFAEAIGLYELVVKEPADVLTYPEARILALERLGPLYEEVGEPDKAVDAYARFAEAWKDADPELQPRVKAARQALARLEGASGG